MEKYLDKIAQTVNDSIPEKTVILEIVAPSFSGPGATNMGAIRIGLTDPSHRKRTQQQLVDAAEKYLNPFNDGRIYTAQEPSISTGGSKSALPVQFVIQNINFDKIKEKLPLFLEEVRKSQVFSSNDVNLKFNKPELNITINRQNTSISA